MILVTVGTQLPFPRLIGILDRLAPELERRIVAQIGDQPETPRNVEWHRNFEPRQFEALFKEADLVVSHAGIGTVLAAKKHRKPLIVFPRQVKFGEHRNDHQLATAAQLARKKGIHVANSDAELQRLVAEPNLEAASGEPSPSLCNMRSRLRLFALGE